MKALHVGQQKNQLIDFPQYKFMILTSVLCPLSHTYPPKLSLINLALLQTKQRLLLWFILKPRTKIWCQISRS